MSRVPRSYFDQMYQADPDPWGFESRWYEQRKYRLTIDALPRPRYRCGFEPGCSIGVLSALLAERCDRLIAADPVPSAIGDARQRLASTDNVDLRVLSIPEEWPQESYDLVVLSEIGYYFDRPELEQVLAKVIRDLEAGGTLVAVHWTGPTDYPLTGHEVHQLIAATPSLQQVVDHRDAEFVLGVWQRTAP
jgi:SAM-dependent methyltransferase